MRCVVLALAAAAADSMVRGEAKEDAAAEVAPGGGSSWRRALLGAGLGALALQGGAGHVRAHGALEPWHGAALEPWHGAALEPWHGAALEPWQDLTPAAWELGKDAPTLAAFDAGSDAPSTEVHAPSTQVDVPPTQVAVPSTQVDVPSMQASDDTEMHELLEQAYPLRSVYYSFMHQLDRMDGEVQPKVDGLVGLAFSEKSHVPMPYHMQLRIVDTLGHMARTRGVSDKHPRAAVAGLLAMAKHPKARPALRTRAAEGLLGALGNMPASGGPAALDALAELAPRFGADQQGQAAASFLWAITQGQFLSRDHLRSGLRGLEALAGTPAGQTEDVLRGLRGVLLPSGAAAADTDPIAGVAAVEALAAIARALPAGDPRLQQAIDLLAALKASHTAVSDAATRGLSALF